MLFLPMILAMMGFGLTLWALQAADHAAREGARLAAVGVTDCHAWRAAVEDRGGFLANMDAKFEFQDTNADTHSDPGDTITVSIRYAVPGAPHWMLEAATAILPGDSTFTLPDGSSTPLETKAETRDEAPGPIGEAGSSYVVCSTW
jgi:hypothetical protein